MSQHERNEMFWRLLDVSTTPTRFDSRCAAYFETGGVTRPRKDADEAASSSTADAILEGVSTGDVVALGGVWAKVNQRTLAPHLVPYVCSVPELETPPDLTSQSSLGALRWLLEFWLSSYQARRVAVSPEDCWCPNCIAICYTHPYKGNFFRG